MKKITNLSSKYATYKFILIVIWIFCYCNSALSHDNDISSCESAFYNEFHILDSIQVNNEQIYTIMDKFIELEQGAYYYPDLIIVLELGKIDKYYISSQYDLSVSTNYSCYLMISSIMKSIAWYPAYTYGYFTYHGFYAIIVCPQNNSYGLFSKTGKRDKLYFYRPKPNTLMSQDDSHTQLCFYYDQDKDEFICDWESIHIGSTRK